MNDFTKGLISAFAALIIYEFLKRMENKWFFWYTRFLLDACEKELGVKCMCTKATIQVVKQCAIIPLEKYDYAMFEMNTVKFLRRLSQKELSTVIKRAFVEKEK